MSEIISTEAVVLRSMKYRETSKIVNFYTRESGKVSGIVKGVRQSKNKYGSVLEPMTHVSLVYYQKDGRELQLVSSCERLNIFRYLMEDIDKMSAGLQIVEMMNSIAHEQEQNIPMFTLLVDALSALNSATKNAKNVLYSFQLKLAGVLGFHPTFDSCIKCAKDVLNETDSQFVDFHLDKGGPLCQIHRQLTGHKQKLSKHVLFILAKISSIKKFNEVFDIGIEEQLHEQLHGCLSSYLQFHVTGIRPSRTRKVFSKVMGAA